MSGAPRLSRFILLYLWGGCHPHTLVGVSKARKERGRCNENDDERGSQRRLYPIRLVHPRRVGESALNRCMALIA